MSAILSGIEECDPVCTEACALGAAYHQARDSGRRAAARQGLWMGVGVYLAFALPDHWLIPDVAAATTFWRFAVGLCALALLEIFHHARARSAWLDLTCAIALVAGYLGWLVPALATQDQATMSYYMVFGTIFMMGANLFFGFAFSLSVVTSGAVLAIFFVTLFWFFPEPAYYKIAFGTFYISCFVFTSFINWRLNAERYNVFLNAHEARRLHVQAAERGSALLQLSNTDFLTGVANRRAIDRRLDEYWKTWLSHRTPFCVLLVDVDFFKHFNDLYGHVEGDRCLTQIARSIETFVRDSGGEFGRYGGEEFIAVIQGGDIDGMARIAAGITHLVETLQVPHRQRPDRADVVTVSVGMSVIRGGDHQRVEALVREADLALYAAKDSGRNCHRIFDPTLPAAAEDTARLAPLLSAAIERGMVHLVYQPIFDIGRHKPKGVEALMRLRLPDGTFVAPSTFIPVAEKTGAIIELGLWAIRTACRDVLAKDRMPFVSVNLSPIQLHTKGFAASVAAILLETEISGARLALEVTEGLDIDMQPEVLQCLSDLRGLGVEIWLDDFGSGYAGLSWLRAIEFDTVKVDRSFLPDATDIRGIALLKDIIALIRNRGNDILIEGVETADQLALLREFGIDSAQGYHLGRPVRAEYLAAA